MPVFPAQSIGGYPATTLHTYDVDHGVGAECLAMFGAFAATSTTPTANLGYFYPIIARSPMQIHTISILNGAVAANSSMDLGMYNEFGTRILATGAVTQLSSAASTYQKFTLASPVLIMPGLYYAAAVYSTTNNRFATSGTSTAIRGRMAGLLESSLGQSTLPTSVTFAAKTTTAGFACISFHGTSMVG